MIYWVMVGAAQLVVEHQILIQKATTIKTAGR